MSCSVAVLQENCNHQQRQLEIQTDKLKAAKQELNRLQENGHGKTSQGSVSSIGKGSRPYAYDVTISLHPHLGDLGLRVNAVVGDVPAADHKRLQDNGFVPQHGGTMTSMHEV